MDIKKIKITAYCLYKRAQGYQLLKNQKGTPYTTARFIKYAEAVNPETFDKTMSYQRVTKQFGGFEPTETFEYLDVERYMFFNRNTNKPKVAKVVDYAKYNSEYAIDPIKYGEKGNMNVLALEARDLSSLDELLAKYESSVALSVYGKNKCDVKTFSKKGFWDTLMYNLNQK